MPAHSSQRLHCTGARAPSRFELLLKPSLCCRHAAEIGVDQCAVLAAHMDRTALKNIRGQTSSLMAEMFEAVIGAIFVDAGFPAVRRVLHTRWPMPKMLKDIQQ